MPCHQFLTKAFRNRRHACHLNPGRSFQPEQAGRGTSISNYVSLESASPQGRGALVLTNGEGVIYFGRAIPQEFQAIVTAST